MKTDAFPMETGRDVGEICFGLDRATDEISLASFIKRFSGNEFLMTLIPRMSDSDIDSIIDLLTRIMKKHLSENEYHKLFLGEVKNESSRE